MSKTTLHDSKARQWFIVDADGKTLGRIATKIANILRGKNKPTFTPHIDCGDGVVVINAEKINMSGNKMAAKKYYTHSGYAGGLKEVTAQRKISEKSTDIITHAVAGMIPKTRLKQSQLARLRVFVGTEHKMDAQQPIPVAF